MTALYNLFVKHNICPDDFYRGHNDEARRVILAFSSFEVEQENKAAEKAQKGAK